MSSLDADLATLRRMIERLDLASEAEGITSLFADETAAFERVQTEVARLREDVKVAVHHRDEYRKRFEAAEAEVARLRQERDKWSGIADDRLQLMKDEQKGWQEECDELSGRAVAAEREVARLQEGLRHIEAQPDSPGAADYMRAHARALQAEAGAAAKNIGGWDEDGTRTLPSPQAEDGAA